MKAHALSLSFFLAVLPALSHPVAVPTADAQQSQESWQLPWSDGSGPVHVVFPPVFFHSAAFGLPACFLNARNLTFVS